jgi:HK97 family phage portal protein
LILSGGSLVTKSTDIVHWRGNTAQLDGRALDILGASYSYSAMYRKQLWVSAAVNKISGATARLPLKTYRRTADGREDARNTPYGLLMQKPSKKVDPFTFWVWVRSILDIYGESFLGKVRDRGGRPVELIRLHPTFMQYDPEKERWSYDDGKRRVDEIPRRDFVHFKHFNPDSERGMSPLEPLRATLENEAGARAANSALWRNGGRPSVTLQHPKVQSRESAERLAIQWRDIHGGVENWAKALVLEEGMTANAVPMNVEELQYIEARKLNREEVCAGYDIPPPVLHILDRATFSNITEQNRALYRDTMAPKLSHIEFTLDMELRDGSFGQPNQEPDFPPDIYAEFLLDEVLRGAFEARATAYQQSDFMTIAEKRQKENLPFIPGTDRIFLNSASLPLGPDGQLEQPAAPEPPPQLALPPARVSDTDTLPVDAIGHGLSADAFNTVMGRLSRVKEYSDINPVTLTAGLNGESGLVIEALCRASSVDDFKAGLKALKG